MDPKLPNLPNIPMTPFEAPPEMEVWEAPFDRWARLADALLRQVPPSDKTNAPRRFPN
jgi:hypothetical protein